MGAAISDEFTQAGVRLETNGNRTCMTNSTGSIVHAVIRKWSNDGVALTLPDGRKFWLWRLKPGETYGEASDTSIVNCSYYTADVFEPGQAVFASFKLFATSSFMIPSVYVVQNANCFPLPADALTDQSSPTARQQEFDVRAESWYRGYLNANVKAINNFALKDSFQKALHNGAGASIRLLGIEGDVKFGLRTRCEWTALAEDIDAGVMKSSVQVRPQMVRVPFDYLGSELKWLSSGKRGEVRKIILASCPGRIGDDRQIMAKVKEIAGPYEDVCITFSEAGDLADELFADRVAGADMLR
eukprot:TRINITY_DN75784_c0_g1_i1.p1 TRINITY_DN75784_c0_g1~~TRINITY_DN75784_c0_g1_i1.p1  ORF type:complete len:342 (+),score=51.62 TRINITY_DN75784_c0_g1_i1:129-1028(+)